MKKSLRAITEKIREAVPLTRVLGLPDGFTGMITCPHPDHDDRIPSACIYPDGRGHCFGAGHPGKSNFDVFDAYCWKNNCGFQVALRALAGMANVDLGEVEDLIGEWDDSAEDLQSSALLRLDRISDDVGHQIICQAAGIVPAPPAFPDGKELERYGIYDLDDDETKAAQTAVAYCEQRGWTHDTLRALRIGYCPHDPTHLWSVLDMIGQNYPEVFLDLDLEVPPCSGLFIGDPLAPWFGGRLILPFGSHPYAVGRVVPGVEALFLRDQKYIKPLHHSEKRPHIWECREQPLLISPPKLDKEGRVVVPSPLDADEVLIVAEGIPDAISAWQTGYPVVSAVTTTTARGRQSQELLGIALELTRRGGEVIFIPDREENRAGEKGMIKTAIPLVEAGVNVHVALLQDGELFGHEPGRGAA